MNGASYVAVRPVKEAGAEPWDHRPWGEKPVEPRCTPNEQRGLMLPAAPATRPEEEPDAKQTVADRRCVAAAIFGIFKRGRSQDGQDDPRPITVSSNRPR
jgi:hypothetical protein